MPTRRLTLLTCLLTVPVAFACSDSAGEGGDEIGDSDASDSNTGESSDSESESAESGTTESTESDSSESSDSESDSSESDSSESESTESESTESDSSDTTDATESDDTTDATESETGDCLPAEIACDGLDEDCNGIVDDLDEGMDGFCDCYRIGIIGNKGANPAANFETWLTEKGTVAIRFGTEVDHVLTEADLEPYDILIVDRLTHVYSPAEAAILQAWLDDGHGMISMAGYANSVADRDNQNSLVSQTGLSYDAPIYLNPTEDWLNHAISEGATAVQIYGGWRVVGGGEVFVRPAGEPNNSFGTTVDIGMGKAIVFSDEWISFDSEWEMIPEVETFWANMIEWVGPPDICFDPQ